MWVGQVEGSVGLMRSVGLGGSVGGRMAVGVGVRVGVVVVGSNSILTL